MRVACWALFALACVPVDDPCASKRDLVRSPAGLELTPGEHPAGWGDATCAQCHQAWTTHTRDCVAVAVDVGDIDADFEDPASCVGCHGGNGVGWLEALRDSGH
jgi:hypothetical protein